VEDSRVTAKLLQHIASSGRWFPITTIAAKTSACACSPPWRRAASPWSPTPARPDLDPGYKLVRDARAAGYSVTTIPGPSALVAALTLSGLPTDRFLFAGLPAAQARRAARPPSRNLRRCAPLWVFTESGRPPRRGTLAALAEALGDAPPPSRARSAKRFEETAAGTLPELAARYADAPPKAKSSSSSARPARAPPPAEADTDAALRDALATLSPSRAAARVAAALKLPRKPLFERAIALAGEE
jgi:16S rRNA (cytidine1402-2'-O)-methyltransferase